MHAINILRFSLFWRPRSNTRGEIWLEVAAMICPYCDVEYTLEHPCFCQPKSAAAHPEKFTLVPPPEKQKGIEHPPTGLNNPFWN
jgi:hypothetical protein